MEIIICMKSILSPYDDVAFNEYLLTYIKKRLTQKCFVFTKDDTERRYFLDDNPMNYYTSDDIVKSLKLNGRLVYFSNQELINHAVYDLSQRFWYDELKHINNAIHRIFLDFKRMALNEENSLQPRKLSHVKRAHNRAHGVR